LFEGGVEDQREHNEVDALWDSGECGGFECYIAADDEEERGDGGEDGNSENAKFEGEDDNSELLSVRPGNNMLNLVLRDVGTLR